MWSKIQEMRSQGMSKSKIARELGINRETVSSYLSMDESQYHSWAEKIKARVKVLEPYRDKVVELLRKDRSLSSPAICDRLRELNDDFPYICEKTMYNFVKSVRDQEKLPREKSFRQYERLEETAYGEYAQVDFGQHWMPTQDGKRKQIYFMVMILCRSRAKYVCFADRPFTSQKAVEATRSHLSTSEVNQNGSYTTRTRSSSTTRISETTDFLRTSCRTWRRWTSR